MKRHVDLPPVWLLGFLGLAWLQGRYLSFGLTLDGWITDLLSGILIGAGILAVLLAVMEFRKFRTTLHPHHDSDRLIQSGIFKRTRNPIYIADLLILAGFVLRFDAVISLALVPIFLWVIERRFVIPEENRLRRQFRADFARYCNKTPRWI